MLIKSTDDKTSRVRRLEELRKSTVLNASQRNRLDDELKRLQRGIAGERSAAHYLDNYLKDDPDRVVLHDLRIVFEGEVAQIDHLMLTRGLHAYLIETKNFNGNIHINDHGEFSVAYGNGKTYGIESPIEQSRRHERVLRKLFERLDIKGRLGRAAQFHHCVLIDPKGVIHRPPQERFDTSEVMKADQFATWHQKFVGRGISLTEGLASVANILAIDTLREYAEKLATQHRPSDLLSLPEFMKPPVPTTPPVAPRTAHVAAPPQAAAVVNSARPAPEESLKRKLVCAECGTKITFAEGKFCWNNEARFGGFQYCRAHQDMLA